MDRISLRYSEKIVDQEIEKLQEHIHGSFEQVDSEIENILTE